MASQDQESNTYRYTGLPKYREDLSPKQKRSLASIVLHNEHVPNVRRALAEILGTAILVFVHAGIVLQRKTYPDDINEGAVALAQGATLVGLIYAFGQVSGAHFNPVVTLAFVLRRNMRWSLLPLYWICEFLGGFLGALLLVAFYGESNGLGTAEPKAGVSCMTTFYFEACLTFILVTVILNTANRGHKIGPQSALAVGFTIIFLVLFGRTMGAGSMNPARSFGPAILLPDVRGRLWIFFAGPFLGSVVATGVNYAMTSSAPPSDAEREAACGVGRADTHPRANSVVDTDTHRSTHYNNAHNNAADNLRYVDINSNTYNRFSGGLYRDVSMQSIPTVVDPTFTIIPPTPTPTPTPPALANSGTSTM